jgi:acyl-CoA hydrolase
MTHKPNINTVAKSQTEMAQYVLPNDTNRLGNLLGGRLMEWIDICAAIAAQRHTRNVCVTASVDELTFHHPIHQAEVVFLYASVNRVFTTSMEVGVRVISEDPLTGKRLHANTAYLTFVAIDANNKPTQAPPIKALTTIEKKRYREAGRRRQLRLLHRRQRQ